MSSDSIDATILEPTATVAESSTATSSQKKPRKVVVLPAKIQKQLESLKAKNEKLAVSNKALKSQLQDLKSSHSRIRRIPKVPVVPETSSA